MEFRKGAAQNKRILSPFFQEWNQDQADFKITTTMSTAMFAAKNKSSAAWQGLESKAIQRSSQWL